MMALMENAATISSKNRYKITINSPYFQRKPTYSIFFASIFMTCSYF